MQAQVARIQHPLAARLNQERHAVEGRVIHRIGRDREVADDDGLPGFHEPLVFTRHPALGREDGTGQQHLAGALGHEHRDVRVRVTQQAAVIRVRVREKDRVHLAPGGEQAVHDGGQSLWDGFATLQPGLGLLRLGHVVQRQPDINDDTRRGRGNLHAAPADLLAAPVNDELHRL